VCLMLLFVAAQAQSKIKILEKLPELEAPEADESETFKCASPPSSPLSRFFFRLGADSSRFDLPPLLSVVRPVGSPKPKRSPLLSFNSTTSRSDTPPTSSSSRTSTSTSGSTRGSPLSDRTERVNRHCAFSSLLAHSACLASQSGRRETLGSLLTIIVRVRSCFL
jgi:hypothetical protein